MNFVKFVIKIFKHVFYIEQRNFTFEMYRIILVYTVSMRDCKTEGYLMHILSLSEYIITFSKAYVFEKHALQLLMTCFS